MSKIGRNYYLNMISQVLRLVTPLITTPYISRVLGADNVGIFSYTYSIQSYFALFAVLGTASYGAREISRNRNNKKKISKLFWEIELLTVITSITVIILWTILVVVSQIYKRIFIILTIYLLAAMIDISWLFVGLEMFPYLVVRNIFIKIAEVISIFCLVKNANDLEIYCMIMATGTLIGNISLWSRLGVYIEKVEVSKLHISEHFRGTMIFFLPSIATSLYTVLDKTLIGVITHDIRENGYYEQATKVIGIAKAIAFISLNTVLGPRSAYLYANEKYDEIKKNLDVSVNIMFFLGFGLCFGIIGLAELFVPWFFGEGYDKVSTLLQLLSPIIVVIIVSNALGYQYYDPAGLRAKSSRYLIIGASCNLVLNCILIPQFKSLGAVVASVLSEILISSLYLLNCDEYLRINQIVRLSYKKFVAGIFMLAVLKAGKEIFSTTDGNIIILIVFGFLFYCIFLIILRDSIVDIFITRVLLKINHNLIYKE